MKNKNKDIELILFDLGGVLVELGQHPFPPEWYSSSSKFGLSDWFHSKTAMAFESGQLSPQQFAQTLIEELHLNTSPKQLLEEFTAWPKSLYPGAKELLLSLKQEYRIAILSNTNELHWPRMLKEFQLQILADHCFASHLMQLAKPNPKIYLSVLQQLNVKPEKVLFFDDNSANVASAAKVGIHAVQVKGIAQLSETLKNNFS